MVPKIKRLHSIKRPESRVWYICLEGAKCCYEDMCQNSLWILQQNPQCTFRTSRVQNNAPWNLFAPLLPMIQSREHVLHHEGIFLRGLFWQPQQIKVNCQYVLFIKGYLWTIVLVHKYKSLECVCNYDYSDIATLCYIVYVTKSHCHIL